VAYAPDYETIAEVSTARLSALAAYFGQSKGRAVDAARWSAIALAYAPDYESIAEVSTARWSALGEQYLAKAAQGQ